MEPGFYEPVPGMYDDEYTILNLGDARLSSHALIHQSETISVEDIDALEELSANDTAKTPWEKELMCFRLSRYLVKRSEKGLTSSFLFHSLFNEV